MRKSEVAFFWILRWNMLLVSLEVKIIKLYFYTRDVEIVEYFFCYFCNVMVEQTCRIFKQLNFFLLQV